MSVEEYSSARVPLLEGTLQLLIGRGSSNFELRFGSGEGTVLQAVCISPDNLAVLQDQIGAALAFLAEQVGR